MENSVIFRNSEQEFQNEYVDELYVDAATLDTADVNTALAEIPASSHVLLALVTSASDGSALYRRLPGGSWRKV